MKNRKRISEIMRLVEDRDSGATISVTVSHEYDKYVYLENYNINDKKSFKKLISVNENKLEIDLGNGTIIKA